MYSKNLTLSEHTQQTKHTHFFERLIKASRVRVTPLCSVFLSFSFWMFGACFGRRSLYVSKTIRPIRTYPANQSHQLSMITSAGSKDPAVFCFWFSFLLLYSALLWVWLFFLVSGLAHVSDGVGVASVFIYHKSLHSDRTPTAIPNIQYPPSIYKVESPWVRVEWAEASRIVPYLGSLGVYQYVIGLACSVLVVVGLVQVVFCRFITIDLPKPAPIRVTRKWPTHSILTWRVSSPSLSRESRVFYD